VWFVRQIAWLMRESKGALTHSAIMNLTWRQFGVYLDSFTWIAREQTKEGQQENRRDDLKAKAADPRAKAWKKRILEETKRAVQKSKDFAATNPTGGETKNLLE
jgi:hypothetical protein